MTNSGDLGAVGRFGLVAGVAALLCLAAPEIESAGAEDREQAAVTSPAGVIGLPRGAGRVRVLISATSGRLPQGHHGFAGSPLAPPRGRVPARAGGDRPDRG